MKKDIDKINNHFVKNDKSNNIYEMSPRIYKKLLNHEITKFYMKAPDDYKRSINIEAKSISYNLTIKQEILGKKVAFLMLKDHKCDFENNSTFRLLNASKIN